MHVYFTTYYDWFSWDVLQNSKIDSLTKMSWNQFEATEAFTKCYFEYLVLLLVAEIHLKCISKKILKDLNLKLPVYVPIYLRKNDKKHAK